MAFVNNKFWYDVRDRSLITKWVRGITFTFFFLFPTLQFLKVLPRNPSSIRFQLLEDLVILDQLQAFKSYYLYFFPPTNFFFQNNSYGMSKKQISLFLPLRMGLNF